MINKNMSRKKKYLTKLDDFGVTLLVWNVRQLLWSSASLYNDPDARIFISSCSDVLQYFSSAAVEVTGWLI